MHINFKFNILLSANFIKVKRCLIYKDITKFNILSRILYNFLVCMTFDKVPAHNKFGYHCIDIFTNCHEFRGTYSYCEIADEFGLTNTLKRFSYINRVMKREPHNKLIFLYFKLKDTIFRYIFTIKFKGRPFKRPFDILNFQYV